MFIFTWEFRKGTLSVAVSLNSCCSLMETLDSKQPPQNKFGAAWRRSISFLQTHPPTSAKLTITCSIAVELCVMWLERRNCLFWVAVKEVVKVVQSTLRVSGGRREREMSSSTSAGHHLLKSKWKGWLIKVSFLLHLTLKPFTFYKGEVPLAIKN